MPPKPRRSVFARGTDLLVISLLLILSLTLGRQVLEWWHDDVQPVAPASRSTPAWGAGGQPVELEFGNAPGAMSRQVVQGDLRSARVKLADRCAEIVPQVQPPAGAADQAEQEMVKTLLARKPVAEAKGQWRVCHLEGPFEVVIGLRAAPSAKDNVPSAWRVVCWGSVLPMAGGSWALHLYTAQGPVTTPGTGETIPLPPVAQRLMSLGEAGTRVVGFTSKNEAECVRFYDGWFAGQGWTNSGWQATDRTKTACFVHQAPADGQIVYVQLTRGDQGVTGLVSSMPGPKPVQPEHP